jgi:ureidoglycolate hydrolase
MFSWMDVRRQRKFICENLERHINCTECIIPIDGSSICVVTLSENMEDPKSPVSLESMKAFFMDGSLAINLKKAVWHWIPYPISEKASFILVFGEETSKKDLEIIDLKKDYNLSVKLILEK